MSTMSPEANVTPAVRLGAEFISGFVFAASLASGTGIVAAFATSVVSMVGSDQLGTHLASELGHLAAESGLAQSQQPAHSQNVDLTPYGQLTGSTQDPMFSGQQYAQGTSTMTISGAAGLTASLSQPVMGVSSAPSAPLAMLRATHFPDGLALAAGAVVGAVAAPALGPGLVAAATVTVLSMAVSHGVQAAEHEIGSHLHTGQQQQWAASPAGTQVRVSSPSVAELPSAQSMRGQGEHPQYQETATMGNTTYTVLQQQSTGMQLS